MISHKEIESALDFLRDSARPAAEAIAKHDYVKSYSSVVLAEIMAEHQDLTLGAQEREAKRSQRYKDHLEIVETARVDAEKYGFLIDAAKAKISAWQTMAKTGVDL